MSNRICPLLFVDFYKEFRSKSERVWYGGTHICHICHENNLDFKFKISRVCECGSALIDVICCGKCCPTRQDVGLEAKRTDNKDDEYGPMTFAQFHEAFKRGLVWLGAEDCGNCTVEGQQPKLDFKTMESSGKLNTKVYMCAQCWSEQQLLVCLSYPPA